MTDKTFEPTACENVAQTMRDTIQSLGQTEHLDPEHIGEGFYYTAPHLVSVPNGRSVQDLTEAHRKAAEYFKPARRTGTAHMSDLASLITWTNRFKGPSSVIFANPDMAAASMTCIANYHDEGAPAGHSPDTTARHCDHRAVYSFPMSKEWKAWMAISDKPLEKDDLGEFIEAQAKDIMDPTPAVLGGKVANSNEAWENRLIETAERIQGRYGQLSELLAMSKQFQVFESSNLQVSTNRDTGEQQIQFVNEHKTPDGQPLRIPNLIIIAIPVFLNGAPYRMAVRFRYRKSGGSIRFIMSLYTPEKVFDAALQEAIEQAKEETQLPVLLGSPEK